MTAALARVPRARYGAIQLKQSYQLNLGLALIAAILLHLTLAGVAQYLLQDRPANLNPMYGPPYERTWVQRFDPGPSIVIKSENSGILRVLETVKPTVGIPVPVADDPLLDGPRVLTRDELAKRYGEPQKLATGIEGGTGIESGDPGLIPGPPNDRVFKPFEKPPIALKKVIPVYPEFALQAGMGGTVYIDARISASGDVIEADIAGESVIGFGFGEAALAALLEWKFQPAVMNGHAVEVWYNIPIVFQIER